MPGEQETAFLKAYRERRDPRPSVTVDLVILTVLDRDLKLLLIQRGEPPFLGAWALPGGFLRVGDSFDDQGEDLEAAARRELKEETGLEPDQLFLEQLYTFGRAGRDPRTRVITVAYYALIRPDLIPLVQAGGDAHKASWFSIAEHKLLEGELPLAFDHQEILELAIQRIRGKIDYSAIGFDLVPVHFTVAELRSSYEAIKGTHCDPGNFRRRFRRWREDGLIEQAAGKRHTGSRPARVYRFCRERQPRQ